MLYTNLRIDRHLAVDETKFYFWDNENTNAVRNGLSWTTAWRDKEGSPGIGEFSFIKATNTPYRMDLNTSIMSNDTFFCDCTGIGFERSAKKADFRASDTFSFTQHSENIYKATVVDVRTGPRSGAYNLDYLGHYIFSETLNYEGAWGVWQVTGELGNNVIPLIRTLEYDLLEHGKWYWESGTLYICWEQEFVSSHFEIVRKAKAFEMWTDNIQTDGRRSRVSGIRSRFGLFGHHNGACNGWQITDSELSWNAIDGLAIIAENTYSKTYGLYTQVYRCEIHHNFRDGVTNYTTPAGAAGRGNSAWADVNIDFCFIHDNGGAGVFLHRLSRFTIDTNYQNTTFPFYLGNNTIIGNNRGVVITDERMLDVINTFGYDYMTPEEWESKTFQQKAAYWDSLLSEYDTAYVKLRNNNIYNNAINKQLITTTWSGTTFVIDSDYNNIFPNDQTWVEGSHSLSVDPDLVDSLSISGGSALYGTGTSPFIYPMNSDAYSAYFSIETNPYEYTKVSNIYNIGASWIGAYKYNLVMARRAISSLITTGLNNIQEGNTYIVLSEKTTNINTNTGVLYPEEVIVVERNSVINTSVSYVDIEVVEHNNRIYINIDGAFKPTTIYILSNGVWKEALYTKFIKDGALL